MCNLYSLTKSREAIVRLFKVPHNRAAVFDPVAAIFPARSAPVIRPTADGALELVIMSWGFVLPQPGKAPRRVTNVRDDKARGSAFWRDSFESRRCLVPATSLFAFAGIWRRWKGPIKKDGPAVEIETYSFMTTEPNALTSGINHERSPVVLATEAAREAWLHGSADDAFALARPFPAAGMRIVREGFEKADSAA
jgi:putative SOS response-associated peptidase YedK